MLSSLHASTSFLACSALALMASSLSSTMGSFRHNTS